MQDIVPPMYAMPIVPLRSTLARISAASSAWAQNELDIVG